MAAERRPRAVQREGCLTPRSLYGLSKAAAEAGLRKLAQECDMRITVVRPPLVYAPAQRQFRGADESGAAWPAAAIRGDPQSPRLPVGGKSGVIHRAQARQSRWQVRHIFLVADAEQVSTPDFIRRLRKRPAPDRGFSPMPTALLSAC